MFCHGRITEVMPYLRRYFGAELGELSEYASTYCKAVLTCPSPRL